MLRPGDMVGDFVIEGLIGSGGMGSVYRARHPIIGRKVAIKVLGDQWKGRADAVARFVREARTIHRLEHRGVPDILTFGTLRDGTHYYVMELLEGEDLRTRMRRVGRIAPARAVEIVASTASILDAAHDAGIIHRDLKPENVFLAGNEVKLLDFGIAKLSADSAETDGFVTTNRTILGTPVYMAPEQFLQKPIDRRCDIYGLGVLAYEMLAGAAPFPATAPDLMERKIAVDAPLLSKTRPELARFDRAIASALSRDPAARQPTASRLATELAAALEPTSRTAMRIGGRLVGAAALALLSLTAIAYYAAAGDDRPNEEDQSFAEPAKPAMIAPVNEPEPEVEPAPAPKPAEVPPRPKRRVAKKRIEERELDVVPDMPVRF